MRRTKELELDLGEASTARPDDDRASDRKKADLPGREADRCRSIRLSRILDPEPDRELDWALVSSIAESARTIGLLHPIAVREVQIKRKSKTRTKTVLVAGAHRLEAARHLGYERIQCLFLDYNDDSTAQVVQVGENLFRKHLTVLRHAELITKWYELVSKDYVYGQVDRKNKRGRPPKGTSRILRDLPVGTTIEARRKILARARKIARIQPEAKQAAIDAKLDNNQQALLAIAAMDGRKAQLKKVAKLTKSSADQQHKRDDANPDSEGSEEADEPERVRKVAKATNSSDEQEDVGDPDTDGSEEADEPETRREHNKGEPSQPETSFGQLEELWQKEFRELWTYAPFEVRERFISMLRRARSKAPTDSVRFVKDVFQGREKVYARHLYALAQGRGLSKKVVRMVLNGLCYHRKRSGYGSSGRYYYRNINRNWKNELPVFSEAELMGGQRRNRAAQESGPSEKTEGAKTNTSGKDREETRPSQLATISPFDDYFPF
jgi:ParB-like chromosome segregation protein Spo0J